MKASTSAPPAGGGALHGSIVHVLFDTERRKPRSVALREKVDGRWREITWREYADEVRRVARGLIRLGIQPGQSVCIVGWNSPEWLIADLAVMAVGAVPAPLYANATAEQAAYIARHCDAQLLFADTSLQIDKLRGAGTIRNRVQMKGAPASEGVLSWDGIRALGAEVDEAQLQARLAGLEPQGLATLIYTSGTTGPPKGVMLTHRNLVFTAASGAAMLGWGPEEVHLSYLPLSHIAEQILSLHGPVTIGSTVCFAESLEKLGENLAEVRPTIFLGVPRVWEKIQARMAAAGKASPPLRRRIVAWARQVGTEAARRLEAGKPPPWNHAIAGRLVFSKVRARLGLDRARLCISSTAPISPSTLEFFFSLGIPIQEVYGMTECTGPATVGVPGAFRIGTAGRPIPATEVGIAQDGEVCMRGGHVFAGYFKDEIATREALDEEGWLHSGDVGELDADGYLKITDRKKDIIITAGGKNVAPQNIEALLKGIPGVAQACVVGDRRKHLAALLTVDRENAASVAKACGAAASTPEGLAGDPAFRRHVEEAIEAVNANLARFETVKRFTILPHEFTVESGELTPTMKLKRKVVVQRYAPQIESMYEADEAVA